MALTVYERPSPDGYASCQNYVYIAIAPHGESHAFVKVGVSQTPDKRLGAIATSCPVPIHHLRLYRIGRRSKAFRIEDQIHHLLTPYHSNGEWFIFDMADKAHKEALWGAVRYVMGRAFTKPPAPLDLFKAELDTLRRAHYLDHRAGRKKMLKPIDTASLSVVRSTEISKNPQQA